MEPVALCPICSGRFEAARPTMSYTLAQSKAAGLQRTEPDQEKRTPDGRCTWDRILTASQVASRPPTHQRSAQAVEYHLRLAHLMGGIAFTLSSVMDARTPPSGPDKTGWDLVDEQAGVAEDNNEDSIRALTDAILNFSVLTKSTGSIRVRLYRASGGSAAVSTRPFQRPTRLLRPTTWSPRCTLQILLEPVRLRSVRSGTVLPTGSTPRWYEA
jgi:hypothetical protein